MQKKIIIAVVTVLILSAAVSVYYFLKYKPDSIRKACMEATLDLPAEMQTSFYEGCVQDQGVTP